MSIIEALYNGEINPSEGITNAGTEYRKLQHELSEASVALRSQLSEQTEELLDNYINLQLEMAGIREYKRFETGFALGAKFMCECMHD